MRYIWICIFENIAFVCLKTQRTGATDKDVLPGFVSPIPCLLLLCADFPFRFVTFCFSVSGIFPQFISSSFFHQKSVYCLLHSVVLAFLYLSALYGMLMVFDCVMKYKFLISSIFRVEEKHIVFHKCSSARTEKVPDSMAKKSWFHGRENNDLNIIKYY